MILFAGIPSEDPLAFAITQAERIGVPYRVFNQRHLAGMDMAMSHDDRGCSGTLWIGGEAFSLDRFTGIYARTIGADQLPELRTRGRTPPDPLAAARARTLTALFDDLLDIAPARVCNPPSAMGSNLSKPFQAHHVRAAGLLTPPTLVTNDPNAVRAFHAAYGRIVYKSVSGIRSIVREWQSDDDADGLTAVAVLPTQFQAFVAGDNIRVHVIGDRLFATRILSDAIDYRYGERDGLTTRMEPTTLPDAIAAACVALTADLRLAMSGIDLKRTPDGQWYCFEVNPSPAYSYFEEHGGQPIAATLVQWLARADR